MLKNLIVLIVLSLGVVLGIKHLEPILMALVTLHHALARLLLQVFAGGKVGLIIRNVLGLMIIPMATASFPTAIYWMAKKRFFPYCLHVMWALWLVQTTALIALYRVSF